jgi:hypothetical protein
MRVDELHHFLALLKTVITALSKLIAKLERLLTAMEASIKKGKDSDVAWTIAGIPREKFQNTPFVDVGRRLVRDGPEGPVMATGIFSKSMGMTLTDSLINDQTHMLEVMTHQVSKGSGTIQERKGSISNKIWKVNQIADDFGLVLEKPNRRGGLIWVLKRMADRKVIFSVDQAMPLVQEASDELKKRNYGKALLESLAALDRDCGILEAHEVLCQAAVHMSVSPDVIDRVGKSFSFLQDRVEQIGFMLKILDRSRGSVQRDALNDSVEYYAVRFAREHERLERIIKLVLEKFGSFDRQSPAGRAADEAIDGIRNGSFSFEQLQTHPIKDPILNHPYANWLRDKIVKDAGARDAEEQQALRARVNAQILYRVLDPKQTPSISAICKSVEHMIPDILNPDPDRSARKDVSRLIEAKDTFYATRGHHASIDIPEEAEELARIMQCSVERVKQIDAQQKDDLIYLDDPDRCNRNRTNRVSDEDDVHDQEENEENNLVDDSFNDDDDEEDEGLGGILAPVR